MRVRVEILREDRGGKGVHEDPPAAKRSSALLHLFGSRAPLSPGPAIKGAQCWATWKNRRRLGRPGGSE